ncbi:hypothetical protein SDC9_185643 [bioreactor metagenome]|uniref:Uncharacterized protein n=1 Tax=bioreactor metagenome TaxID=1076179 RepID=A0A645HIU9_9ZZZZ
MPTIAKDCGKIPSVPTNEFTSVSSIIDLLIIINIALAKPTINAPETIPFAPVTNSLAILLNSNLLNKPETIPIIKKTAAISTTPQLNLYVP